MCHIANQSDSIDESPIIKGSNNIQDSEKKSDTIMQKNIGKNITRSVIFAESKTIDLSVSQHRQNQKSRAIAEKIKSNERDRLRKKDDDNQNKFNQLM